MSHTKVVSAMAIHSMQVLINKLHDEYRYDAYA